MPCAGKHCTLRSCNVEDHKQQHPLKSESPSDKPSICDSEPSLVLGRAMELVLVVPVHAQERSEALVDLYLERVVGVLLAVDREVAVGRERLDAVRVRLEVVLLRETYK